MCTQWGNQMGFKGLAGNCYPLESISKLSLFHGDFLEKSGKFNKIQVRLTN